MEYFQINVDGKMLQDHYSSIRTAKVMSIEYLVGVYGSCSDFRTNRHNVSVFNICKNKYSLMRDNRSKPVFIAEGRVEDIISKIAGNI